jgi:hypothetical protein
VESRIIVTTVLPGPVHINYRDTETTEIEKIIVRIQKVSKLSGPFILLKKAIIWTAYLYVVSVFSVVSMFLKYARLGEFRMLLQSSH